jgi:hypothetical protein
MEYKKYSGHIKSSGAIKHVKKFHNMVKKYFIDKYSNDINVLIDIGSGRGSDARYWVDNNIKFAIGIEPSDSSIKQAIINYVKLQKINKGKKITKIQYLNGQGQKNWSSGSASLKKEHIGKFKHLFGTKNDEDRLQADNINLFWTIHYMMNTEKEFNTLMDNIDKHTHSGSTVTILCMDGEKIDGLLKKNDGSIIVNSNEEYNNQMVFKISALYPYKVPTDKLPIYGNKISVLLASTYGLEKGIEENLVLISHLINEFEKRGFQLILNKNFLEINIPELNDLRDYERKISELYVALVFKKK